MRATSNVRIKNKKATFNYEILETYTAGIELLGTEIKSIRNNKAGLNETYCTFVDGELYIKNMYIAEYELGGYVNHEPRRDRKLLLNRQELNKWEKKMKERGFTIIPLSLFVNANGLVKIDVALARGKKQYDKRETIKDKDNRREMDRMHKER
ncbi:MAG TPA: SsrA-binding protein [Marinilabiliales bacterium]|jgi:SsrA-binding protein|nr:SsrA-binding protein [Salinivirgaceae bacterium]OFX39287.1 MAG: SsrA-binding protein [Bacteroidetes bacterium GWA2_40_14]OFX63111.1 MAG: SsrA-binding protein [Bacteroidetes bacterium GWC2_40_13]OFX75743.1 MAG: SsrA-binding protein [Bacteroidetes bacterium GWD2_40_43]OFX94984.1 MAG: SsrA-binding protein [Bacteroidetes bacterium GWE2_40_63]OFY23495.1 MAG: SsrA-binding protein [Bacteroidetes bacterium GWF2_40_13]OFZ29379.1 MAG: SsrA-binding protein [Bacteroidetes bacterium RIFOXYC2_FULL_40_12